MVAPSAKVLVLKDIVAHLAVLIENNETNQVRLKRDIREAEIAYISHSNVERERSLKKLQAYELAAIELYDELLTRCKNP